MTAARFSDVLSLASPVSAEVRRPAPRALRTLGVAVIIPALNEEAAIGGVVRGFLAAGATLGVRRMRVLVGDNGSTDATRENATRAGASVHPAAVRGYGSACLAAMAGLDSGDDVVVFADGDGADDPTDLGALLSPIAHGRAALVIGSRALGERLGWAEEGALTGPQRFGNALAARILRSAYGTVFSDLGPFRAITRPALGALHMDDMNFGWTVQMQARAARLGLVCRDVPVHYRCRRTGHSKVSGNIVGSTKAGVIILRTLAKEWGPRL